ncbi:MAG: lipopolysaccharide biosynthesis [Thermoleophilia bacterium]|nr:lipopolysaccharide biosynthesis [Thermoleophilia bacterium]
MKEAVSLGLLVRTLRNRAGTIAAVTLLVVGCAVGLTLLQERQYDATATLITGQGKGLGNIESVLAINQTAQSLGQLATERIVVERGARAAGVDEPVEDLLPRTRAEVPPNTPIIRITVRDTDAKRASRLANGIAESFVDLIDDRAGADSNLATFVWQEATPPRSHATPIVRRIGVIALALGMLLGMGVAFLREHVAGNWRSDVDVERTLGVPIVGAIPELPKTGRRGRVTA